MRYIITAHYATWTGNMGSCRRVIEAESEGEALEIMSKRIRTWKKFMGKLSMDCVRLTENSASA